MLELPPPYLPAAGHNRLFHERASRGGCVETDWKRSWLLCLLPAGHQKKRVTFFPDTAGREGGLLKLQGCPAGELPRGVDAPVCCLPHPAPHLLLFLFLLLCSLLGPAALQGCTRGALLQPRSLWVPPAPRGPDFSPGCGFREAFCEVLLGERGCSPLSPQL